MNAENKIVNNEKVMHFEIHEGDNIAFLEYRFHQNNIALMHTDVPGSMEGKGVGAALVTFAFNYAKEHNKRVLVYCPFIASYLKKNPELNYLLDKQSHT